MVSAKLNAHIEVCVRDNFSVVGLTGVINIRKQLCKNVTKFQSEIISSKCKLKYLLCL